MKKFLFVAALLGGCVLIGYAKVDFSKPAPVRQFKPLATQQTKPLLAGVNGSAKKGENSFKKPLTSAVPANVLPISICADGTDETGQQTILCNGCSATRLTPNLVLTAAHCLVDTMGDRDRIYVRPLLQENGQWHLMLETFFGNSYAKRNATVFFLSARLPCGRKE